MTTQIVDPENSWKMSPEMQEVVESYLITTDVCLTAQDLGIPKEKVVYFLNKPECKRFIDTIFLEQGYLNRHRLQDLLSEVMDLKLTEMRESEVGSNKDIADLIALAHKIRTDEAKTIQTTAGPTNQTNVQINNAAGFGDNYNNLLEKLIK
jgi:hypothetical protein